MKKENNKIFITLNNSSLFNILKNSTVLSFPSIIGIILALIAIPIHLEINGKSDYGNFIFFHFIVFFGLLLNIGINKIVAIEIAKNKSNSIIIKQSIGITIYLSLIIFILGSIFSFFLNNYLYYLAITFGLSLTTIYLTLEGILQGLKKYKSLSIVNFVFYTISLNIPSISLFYKNNDFENLVFFSILIKSFAILISITILKKYLFQNIDSNYNFISKIKKYSKWYFIYNINTQVFEIFDKYFIKIIIGPTALAIYSIPYQLAGKITIFSKSISAVLLPEISFGKEREKFSFNQSLEFYALSVPILLLIFFPFLGNFLKLWLGNQYSKEILDLTKIFLIIAWISGISHILITYFEGKKQIKFNTMLEVYLIVPFIVTLLILILNFKNLIFITGLLLIKEIILVIFRSQKIKKKINNLFMIYIIISLVVVNLFISLNFENYYFFSFFILVFLNTSLIIKKYLI